MRNLFILLVALMSLSTQGQNTKRKMSESPTISRVDRKVPVINFDKLETIIKKNDDKLYVVNFWATWCKPCVMELPEFMEVNKLHQNNPNFKMILVSMDIAKEVDSAVQPFILKHKIEADVYLLDDNKRMNQWIPAVDSKWSGAIPATVFYRNSVKLDFRESRLTKDELEQLIHKYL